ISRRLEESAVSVTRHLAGVETLNWQVRKLESENSMLEEVLKEFEDNLRNAQQREREYQGKIEEYSKAAVEVAMIREDNDYLKQMVDALVKENEKMSVKLENCEAL
ncbi:hypothetical protein PMAYCL1PPCAC_28265, partial [Pristionchus mayeri]